MGLGAQDRLAASLILEGLRSPAFRAVRLADLNSGKVDDFVLVWSDLVEGNSVKWTRTNEPLTWANLCGTNEPLVRQLADGWRLLRKEFPGRRVRVYLRTNRHASPASRGNRLVPHLDLRCFLASHWQAFRRGEAVTDPLVKDAWALLRKSSGLSKGLFEEFAREGCHVLTEQTLPQGADPGSRDAEQWEREFDQLRHAINDRVESDAAGADFRAEDIRRVIGLLPSRQRMLQRFPEPEIGYEENSQAVAELQALLAAFDRGYLALVGPAGAGKSTLAQHVIQREPFGVPYFAYLPQGQGDPHERGDSDPIPGNNHAEAMTAYMVCGDLFSEIYNNEKCAFLALGCITLPTSVSVDPSRLLVSPPGLGGKAIAAVRGTLSSLVAVAVDFVSLYRLRDEVFTKTAAGRRYTELYYANTVEVATLMFSNPSFGSQFVSAYGLWKGNISSLVSGQGASAIITQAQIDGLTGVIEHLKLLGSPELRAVLAREQAALNLPSLVGKNMDQALAQQQATAPSTVTIPAAASIHGLASAFFHSDLRVLNPSTTAPVTVTAQFRCFTGPCPANATRSITLAPRELKVYQDVIATLFGAPETAGAIELTGAVLAESRVYTPSLPAPTTGSDVPGLSADEAYADSVLLSLSKSADSGQGFRTNVGVYNPNADGVTFVVTLYGPGGVKLGELTRNVDARSATQVNDVFAAAGITSDVPDAYAIVASDGGKQLFAYATVVDNQSQDSVFVKGRNGRGDGASFVTVPAVASIHGVGSSFFHSDVKVFNASTTLSENVTLRYRCFTGPCPAVLEKTITVAPREMKVLNDVIATLFGGPETAGRSSSSATSSWTAASTRPCGPCRRQGPAFREKRTSRRPRRPRSSRSRTAPTGTWVSGRTWGSSIPTRSAST